MKKFLKLFKALIILLSFHHSYPAFAQTSSVTGTFTDPASQAFANGTYAITFKDAPGATGPSTQGGSAFTKSFSGSLDGSGALAVTLTRNDFIQPSGSKWTFTICPKASVGCTTTDITIAAASVNVSSTINALIQTIKVYSLPNMTYAYSDSEIATVPAVGNTYFNVTTNLVRVWNGSTWQNVGLTGVTTVCSSAGGNVVSTDGGGDDRPITFCSFGALAASKSARYIAVIKNTSGLSLGYRLTLNASTITGSTIACSANTTCRIELNIGNLNGVTNSQYYDVVAWNGTTLSSHSSGTTAQDFSTNWTIQAVGNDATAGVITIQPVTFIGYTF